MLASTFEGFFLFFSFPLPLVDYPCFLFPFKEKSLQGVSGAEVLKPSLFAPFIYLFVSPNLVAN